MRASQLDDNNVVINMIEVERLDILPNLVDGTGGNIGDTWDGTQFIPPSPQPEPVPQSVTMRQARLQLLALGKLADVDAAVATMGQDAQIAWDYSSVVERNHALIPPMQALLGFSDAQMDELFISAAKL